MTIEGAECGLQALLVWLGNYGHMSYEKQQELLWELGEIEIGAGTKHRHECAGC